MSRARRSRIAKAIAAAIGTLATALGTWFPTATADNVITGIEWMGLFVGLVLAAGATFGVYQVRNSPGA